MIVHWNESQNSERSYTYGYSFIIRDTAQDSQMEDIHEVRGTAPMLSLGALAGTSACSLVQELSGRVVPGSYTGFHCAGTSD